jgi:pimeloyl-ACP methyl ester carboxylesterase
MQLKVPAVAGGVLGVVAAGAAATLAGVAYRRRGSAPGIAADGSSADRIRRVAMADGVRLYVEENGPADAELTVFFVHGLALSVDAFTYQRQALTEHFGSRIRLVSFDLRSHGRSDRAAASTNTISQLGADLAELLAALAPVGDIVLVGHSMGAMAMMAFAQQHPDAFLPTGPICSVALLNTSAGDVTTLRLGLPPSLARATGPALPFVLRQAARNAALVEHSRVLGADLSRWLTKRLSFASRDVAPETVALAAAMIAATPVDVVAAFFASLAGHDGLAGVRAMTGAEVLVLAADADSMIPAGRSHELAEELPGVEVVVVEHSGHLLMLEHPALVSDALIGLVSRALHRAEPTSSSA